MISHVSKRARSSRSICSSSMRILLLGVLFSTALDGQTRAEGVARQLPRAGRIKAARERLESAREGAEGAKLPGTELTKVRSGEIDISADIPAGTKVLVKLDTALDSSRNPKGHRFTGTLQADVGSDDALIAARGSTVQGQIISATRPRNIAGQSKMELNISGIMVGKKLRSIESSIVKVVSARTGKDTVRKTVGAAAVGGIADGKDGAAAGAAVGGVGSIVSKGQTAALPKGTVIEFVIGAPGSGVAQQVSDSIEQPEETARERIRERRDKGVLRRR